MAPSDGNPTDDRTAFLQALRTAMAGEDFVQVSLGKPHAADGARSVRIRPVELRGESRLRWVTRFPNRDETQIEDPASTLDHVDRLLGGPFRSGHLCTGTSDLTLEIGKRGQTWLRHAPASHPGPTRLAHDREKHRVLDPSLPFLARLGICDASQRVLPSMSRKWKQCDKFSEILRDAIRSAAFPPGHQLQVLDAGCGKGLLTFCAHHLLRDVLGLDAQVTGLELRAPLVRDCQACVSDCGLTGLNFEVGDLSALPAGTPLDVLIALHACDTATDLALFHGIQRGAKVLLCAPCCHKELRPQLTPPEGMRPILRHGVHLGQEADMVTDSLRALCLEACGYEARVFEFVALEHTAKNKMIVGVKQAAEAREVERARREIQSIFTLFGLKRQTLVSRLGALAGLGQTSPSATTSRMS